jgi:hypothetical protein
MTIKNAPSVCREGTFCIERLMVKKRGNSNWGKPSVNDGYTGPSSFEEIVKRLSLSPDEYEHSAQLKAWVKNNKDQKYVPPSLLQAWNMG